MSSPPESEGARLKSIRKQIYQAQGVDRLKLWLDYTVAQDEDPELQVNQHDPLWPVRAFHVILTLACSPGLDDKLCTLSETSLVVTG